MKEELNVKETMALLGNISRSTLQRLMDSGELSPIPSSPVLLKPRALYFKRSDLEALLKKDRRVKAVA